MRTFAEFITEGVRMHGYWYNLATRKLHNIPDYFSPNPDNTTDWTGHNAWASVPGHAAKLGLTAEEADLLKAAREDEEGEGGNASAIQRAIEKVWQGNMRIVVAYYQRTDHVEPVIYMQAWSLSQPGYVQAAQRVLDDLTRREHFSMESTVHHANFHDYSVDDFASTVEDVHKSRTIAELRKRSRHGGGA